jgi:hypothetical protein
VSHKAPKPELTADGKEYWGAVKDFAAQEREHASGWRVVRMAAWFAVAMLLWYGLISLWLVSGNRWVGPLGAGLRIKEALVAFLG